MTTPEGGTEWASVRETLQQIGFSRWVAAEVGAGGPERLAEMTEHRKETLHSSQSRTRAG